MLANIKNTIIKNTALTKLWAVFSNMFHYLHKKFLWGIFSRIDEKFFKFIFVGIINTLFAYIIYALFITIGLEVNLALFLQYVLGVLWNFKTTGSIVFKNNNNTLILKFIGAYVVTFAINGIFLNFLTKYLNDYAAQAILVPFIAVLSFLIFKFYVFKDK